MNLTSRAIRDGVKETSYVLDQAQSTAVRPAAFTYVPPSHARALAPDATLIEGIRGSGKSFWFAQLASADHRAYIGTQFPEAKLPSEVEVAQGFGMGLPPSQAPDIDTLASLAKDFLPRSIWRAVIGRHAGVSGAFANLHTWRDRVAWVQENAEAFAGEIEAADRRFAARGQTLLILFDALDRMATDWNRVRQLARSLLQVSLDLRSTRALRCKVYVRPDLLEDSGVTSFSDYSKLQASKASLVWNRADLYALLYQCLGNAKPSRDAFAELLAKVTPGETTSRQSGNWSVPAALRQDEAKQETLFESIAGPAMGSNKKRGKPYTWIVNHLQDGFNQVSPRSFYAALGTAATATADEYHLAIDYRGIQRGVQEASQIRVKEITEDYPWVQVVMQPLRGRITVPCDTSEVEGIWEKEGTLVKLESQLRESEDIAKLPPQNLERGSTGILEDLQTLGMLQRIHGRRIQMPDVYRVAFGFGRRGGVKPLK